MSDPSSFAKGLEGVVAASTRLSDVRGESGEHIYCGFDINELAGKVTFEEVVHLLHHNHLPSQRELTELKTRLAAARELPPPLIDCLRKLPRNTPPMHVLRTGVSAVPAPLPSGGP